MSFNILEITNKTGDINKNFSYVDGEVCKTSNAQVYDASFRELTFTTLEEFDLYITSNLQSNQAICLGKSKHNLTAGTLLTKGREDLSKGIISRTNDYLGVQS
ncbi:hypothetical protein GJV85_03485 [Sulfurimonas aquatica]|uniref:Uncharacterized protein n=1 Tax=Sulfurimonas aquatica TaxID=2672570 RepID=A0A975GC72_9BACT|nr:hypothetical protein [Sulfurimonas aquatica]QSZ41212.1 hypothetical protein GJV85_03485 [Sulfurimonas aquatica]